MEEMQVTSTWNQMKADSVASASAQPQPMYAYSPTSGGPPPIEGLGRANSYSGAPVTAGGAATFSPISEPIVSFGETDFPTTLEVKYLQTNDLDDAIADIEKKLAELQVGIGVRF